MTTINVIEHDDREYPFTVRSYDLADALGCTDDSGQYRDNGKCEQLIRDHLRVLYPDLEPDLQFASEMGCFFAYAKTMLDAYALRLIIDAFVADSTRPSEVF